MPAAYNDSQLASARPRSGAKMAESASSFQHCIWLERLWYPVLDSEPQIYELVTYSLPILTAHTSSSCHEGPWSLGQVAPDGTEWCGGGTRESGGPQPGQWVSRKRAEKPRACPPPEEALRGTQGGLVWGERRAQGSEGRTAFKEEDGGNWDKTKRKPTGWAVA